MGYLYEQLGDERFQEFCQALLIRDFPNLQCFPVGQPDGGRDALSPRAQLGDELVVAQVKFKREDDDESADWMIGALKKELPKIRALVEAGAEKYLVMTNARGTAHPRRGRIDRVQTWLDKNVSVPAQCLWRDDLDRRLDGAGHTFKLRYPSILTGDDTIALIARTIFGPRDDQRARTLRAFTAEQFRHDEEVKFRQVELANTLLSLFVDIPADVTHLIWGRKSRGRGDEFGRRISELAVHSYNIEGYPDDSTGRMAPTMTAFTADLLLDRSFQEGAPWVILQGAPGQGKSTLAQYVCQVHRARYLERREFSASLPSNHLAAPFRFPIKVDLRDIDAYLRGASYLGRQSDSGIGAPSLEGFISSLISIQSGGLSFCPDDLMDTAQQIPLLLFFDGLDEVANLESRAGLVAAVTKGLNRLREVSADLQVVVTSRPSLFGRAVSFGADFTTLSLAPIERDTIEQYAKKWVSARGLDQSRAGEVNSILREKLDLGHIRELTKNPMQLTILLSLILAIGHSLPDVRTELYREYVNLFMTREAEKSSVVRQHRGLLSELVEYLAWLLQAGAEADRSSGSVSESKLREIVSDYLVKGAHNVEILDDLFRGGIERVWVLVQRVEGLYEFEVQPLREYFAAKYLYETAPHSSRRHRDVHGDRSDRFEAMAVNPYWANVTRFYAGFYASGEIGALSESLRELTASPDLAQSLSARNVGASLLSDWVFKSKKYIQREVIDLVFDRLGVDVLARPHIGGFGGVRLDPECGQAHLAGVLFNDHIRNPAASSRVANVLRANGGSDLLAEFREWIVASNSDERGQRIKTALRSGAFSNSADLIETITGDNPSVEEEDRRLLTVLHYQQTLLNSSESLSVAVLEAVLRSGGTPTVPTSDVGTLSVLLGGDPLGWSFLEQKPVWSPEFQDPRLVAVREILSEFSAQSDRLSRERIDPVVWDDLIESVRRNLGDCWATYRLAALNLMWVKAGVRLPKSSGDSRISLFDRALLARSWRSSSRWEYRLTETQEYEQLFWLALLLAWGPSRHVRDNLDQIAGIVGKLEDADYVRLTSLLQLIQRRRSYRGGAQRSGIELPKRSPVRLSQVLFFGFGDVQYASLSPDAFADDRIRRHKDGLKMRQKFAQFPGWPKIEDVRGAKKWFDLLARARVGATDWYLRGTEESPLEIRTRMTSRVARAALAVAAELPDEVVAIAYFSLMGEYQPAPVRTVAETNSWSFE